jgi:hypothetical protein
VPAGRLDGHHAVPYVGAGLRHAET